MLRPPTHYLSLGSLRRRLRSIDSYKFLYEEAEQEECGRLLTLNIHPWILGQAHRTKYFEQTLSYLKGQEEVCFASAQSIIKMIGLFNHLNFKEEWCHPSESSCNNATP